MRKKTCMVLLTWYLVHTSKTFGGDQLAVCRSVEKGKKLSVTASYCISTLYFTGCDKISMYHIVRLWPWLWHLTLSGIVGVWPSREPWITIWSRAQAEPSSTGPGCCMIPHKSFGVWSRWTRISHGILECQAFSNDFVWNVKHSSEAKKKINSMLMYDIGGFCSCCTAGTCIH